MATYLLPATDRVRVYVDGIAVEVPANYNLIQAAQAAGVFVPHYCWHPSLSIPGNCRLCLVKMEGAPRMVAGCHTPVKADAKIITKDAEVDDSRRGMMEFLLANHPLDCPQCDRGGECLLQRYSMDYGVGETRFAPNQKRRYPKPDFDDLIDIERNRCILCTRCTRFCNEIAGDPVMGVFGRGDQCYIGTFGDGPVSNIYSGNTIDICPVGCLTNKPYRFKARPWELRQVTSTCTGCSSGCPVTYWMRAGQVMRTTPPAKISEQFGRFSLDADTVEFICNTGRFGNDYGRHADRIAVPRLHGKGASMTAALDATAQALKDAAAKQRVGILVSPKLTTEEMFAGMWLAKVALGTSNIDWRTKLAHKEAADALSQAMSVSNGRLDKLHTYKAVVVLGGSLQQTSPIVALELKEAGRRGQTQLFHAATRLDPFFSDVAKGSWTLAPGQEAAFLSWMGETQAASDPAASIMPLDRAEAGFPASSARPNLASAIGGENKVLVVVDPTAMNGLAAAPLAEALKALRAKLGERLHILTVPAERNALGAFTMGAQPDRLPLGERDDSAIHDAWMKTFGTGARPNATVGLTGPEMLAKAAEGGLDALLVIGGGDALANHPFPELVSMALAKTPFVAVTDLLDGAIAKAAKAVLPSANFYEKSGSFLNIDGRLTHLTKAEQPQGDALSEYNIIAALCARIGAPLPAETPEKLFDRLLAMAQAVGVVTQSEAPDDPMPRATPAPFNIAPRGTTKTRRYYVRPDAQKVAANGFHATMPAITPHAAGKLTLVWHDHLQGHDHHYDRAEQAEILLQPASIELNPADAERLGVSSRDQVNVSIGGKSFSAKLVVRPNIHPGAAYIGRNILGLSFAAGLKQCPEVTVGASS